MNDDFQKPANNLRELPLSHPGIIDIEGFDTHFQLRCYEPSPQLAPFVTHIWVQRRRQPRQKAQKPLVEVLSGPNIYLFFTTQQAFIHGITRHEFSYNAFASTVTAGVKFRPGGFYPFLDKPVSGLEPNADITSVFPTADRAFREGLLEQSDEIIVRRLEALLMDKQPQGNKNLVLVSKVLAALDDDASLRTVGSIAQAFHMSERSLQLLFQVHVGVGLKWIITRKRLLETVSQVKERSNSSQAEVAAELGYNSQSHFTRDFKDTTGQLPSHYLRKVV